MGYFHTLTTAFVGSKTGLVGRSAASAFGSRPEWVAPAHELASTMAAPTSLYANPLALMDHSKEAIQFFGSIRIPAALIAGSSLGALFVMIDRGSRPEREKSKRELAVLFLYHFLSMVALVLSLNVIVTATSASNTMLIGTYYNSVAAESTYDFLMREIPFEYLSTRWSFYTALLCFLKAVMCRALLEFDILRKERIRSAFLVVSSMTGFASHVLHIVNDCLYSYPNLFAMTKGVIQLYARRVWTKKSPMLILASLSWMASLGFLVSLVPRLTHYVRSAPDHKDRFDVAQFNDDNNEEEGEEVFDLNDWEIGAEVGEDAPVQE